MRQSCDVLASYLVDSTTIQTKELVSLSVCLPLCLPVWFVCPSLCRTDQPAIRTKEVIDDVDDCQFVECSWRPQESHPRGAYWVSLFAKWFYSQKHTCTEEGEVCGCVLQSRDGSRGLVTIWLVPCDQPQSWCINMLTCMFVTECQPVGCAKGVVLCIQPQAAVSFVCLLVHACVC